MLRNRGRMILAETRGRGMTEVGRCRAGRRMGGGRCGMRGCGGCLRGELTRKLGRGGTARSMGVKRVKKIPGIYIPGIFWG